MKIYDCITYCGEDLLLNIRFETLNNEVDKFIIIAKRFRNNRNLNANTRKINKRGKYKSFFTIQTLNSLFDDNG